MLNSLAAFTVGLRANVLANKDSNALDRQTIAGFFSAVESSFVTEASNFDGNIESNLACVVQVKESLEDVKKALLESGGAKDSDNAVKYISVAIDKIKGEEAALEFLLENTSGKVAPFLPMLSEVVELLSELECIEGFGVGGTLELKGEIDDLGRALALKTTLALDEINQGVNVACEKLQNIKSSLSDMALAAAGNIIDSTLAEKPLLVQGTAELIEGCKTLSERISTVVPAFDITPHSEGTSGTSGASEPLETTSLEPEPAVNVNQPILASRELSLADGTAASVQDEQLAQLESGEVETDKYYSDARSLLAMPLENKPVNGENSRRGIATANMSSSQEGMIEMAVISTDCA